MPVSLHDAFDRVICAMIAEESRIGAARGRTASLGGAPGRDEMECTGAGVA